MNPQPMHILPSGQDFRSAVAHSQEEDGRDVARLKGELQALLLAMQERIQSLETVQEQQDSAIQVTLYFPAAAPPRRQHESSASFTPPTFTPSQLRLSSMAIVTAPSSQSCAFYKHLSSPSWKGAQWQPSLNAGHPWSLSTAPVSARSSPCGNC